ENRVRPAKHFLSNALLLRFAPAVGSRNPARDSAGQERDGRRQKEPAEAAHLGLDCLSVRAACEGVEATPRLRGRFVGKPFAVAAGSKVRHYAPGARLGSLMDNRWKWRL